MDASNLSYYPRPTALLMRKRLFHKLESSTHPITWIGSPAGSGKTTLITSWLNSNNFTVCWFGLLSGITSVADFCQFLLKTANVTLAQPELWDRPYLLQDFFIQFYALLPNDCILIFDNYPSNSHATFHELFAQFLEVLPIDKRVLVLGRREPPRQLARLRVHGLLHLLCWNDLKFTLDESHALLRMHGDVEQIVVKQLHDRVAGWAAGLAIMRNVPHDAPMQRELFDYFAREIFDVIDAETQRFLLQTCFLQEMSLAHISQLTGIAQPGKMLRFLSEHHCFTERSDNGNYTYHPLFAEFLKIRARSHLSAAEYTQLYQQTASILANNNVQLAINLLTDIRDEVGLAQLLLTLQPELHQHIQLSLDSAWQDYWRARCFPKQTENLLPIIWQQSSSQPLQQLCWIELVHREIQRHQFIALDNLIVWMEDINEFFSPRLQAHVAHAMVSALLYRQPRHAQMPHWLAQSQALIEQHAPQLVDQHRRLIGNYQCWIEGCFVNGHDEHQLEAFTYLAPHLYPAPDKLFWQAWHQQDIELAQQALQQVNGHVLAETACQILIKRLSVTRSDISLAWFSPALYIQDVLLNLHTDSTINIAEFARYFRQHFQEQYWFPETALSQFCAQLLQQNFEVDFIIQIIQQRKLLPPTPIPQWPYLVSLKLVHNEVEIYRYGKLLIFTKKPQKALEMLALMLQNGGTEIDETFIIDCLWSSEGDKAYQSFKFTLHRLRELLGHAETIILKKQKLTINWQYCWIISSPKQT